MCIKDCRRRGCSQLWQNMVIMLELGAPCHCAACGETQHPTPGERPEALATRTEKFCWETGVS
jgi:hypothetical protein